MGLCFYLCRITNYGERKKQFATLKLKKKIIKESLSSCSMMYRKWHGFLALASADYNYPCNITAGECYCDALGWWMLWEVKQSMLIIGSLGCYMDLCKMAPFLPWKGHRTPRKQCSAPVLLSALSSSSAWKSFCPTLIEPLFSVSQRGLFLFTLRREACFVLE